jgi:hypothetical protein
MGNLQALLENPILVKHARSRLRRPQLLPAAAVVVMLQLLLAWFGLSNNFFGNRVVFMINLGMQSLILIVIGAAQVGTTVGSARESGVLDFHRISPLAPWSITLGFLLGAPIMPYVLFALTLPMGLVCVALGGTTFLDFLQFIVLLLMLAVLFHSISMLSALCARKNTKGGPIGVIIVLLIASNSIYGFLSSNWGDLDDLSMRSFFGLKLPWLLFAAIYLLPPAAFAFIASSRKIRSDRAHPLSKLEALAFLATATVLILGAVWSIKNEGAVVVIVVYALVILGCFMTLSITPSAGEYARGVRRAQRQGRAHLPFFDDLAINRVTLAFLCLTVLAGASVAWNFIEGRPQGGGSFSISIAVGVLTVAYIGLAYQYFALIVPARASTLLGLFVFVVWVVPALGVPIAAAARLPEPVWAFLAGFSPVTGLAMADGGGILSSPDIVRIAALIPAIALPFVLNNLVTSARRRIDKAVTDGVSKPPKTDDGEFLLELDDVRHPLGQPKR